MQQINFSILYQIFSSLFSTNNITTIDSSACVQIFFSTVIDNTIIASSLYMYSYSIYFNPINPKRNSMQRANVKFDNNK